MPKNVRLELPLHSLSAISDGGVDLGKTMVILEPGAEATMLSETASATLEGGGMHCGSIELIVEQGARLRYVNLQNWGHEVWHFAHQKAHVGREGRLQWTIGALGSRLAKVNQHVAMTGPDAEVQVNGVMFTEGRQHLSYNTHQHHKAPYCKSDLLYKTALQDRSRTVWRGMIRSIATAQRTDAYQRNDNLMLSRDARADSIPGLEIEADDVRCTHGSTSGRVDDQQLFYAMTRGLHAARSGADDRHRFLSAGVRSDHDRKRSRRAGRSDRSAGERHQGKGTGGGVRSVVFLSGFATVLRLVGLVLTVWGLW